MKAYKAEFRCVKCNGVLTWVEVMGSHGVCPKCGHVSKGTIVDHIKDAIPIDNAQSIRQGR